MSTINTTLFGVLRHLRCRYAIENTDGELLARFARSGDEAAFEEILRRHGPMVLAVCRRTLGPTPDADDAFQATFLILVRKARAIRRSELLAGWLCAVAYRAARQAQRRRDRTGRRERQVERLPEPAFEAAAPTDWRPQFDAAFQRLPARYREPMLLCELQGCSRSDAARQLGLTEGTLSCRLARGRNLLRRKLGPGFVPAAALLAPAIVADRLAAALYVAAGHSAPAVVLQLAEGVMREMFATRLKYGLLLATVTLLAGVGWHVGGAGSVPVRAEEIPAAPGRPAAQPGQPPRDTAHAKPSDGDPVAVIDGDTVLTRRELGDYLIRRYGAEKLQTFVNLRLIETAARRKGITVTEADIDVAIRDELKGMNIPEKDFRETFLKQYNKNWIEWREDVVRPRLLLGKLSEARVTVGGDDLRKAFENQYGPKVRCRMIVWPKSEERTARRVYEVILKDVSEFDRAERAHNTPARAVGGVVTPISRHADTAAGEVVADAAFRLKSGEISPLLAAGDQLVLLKCVGHEPRDESKSFDTEKPALFKAVMERKMANEIPKFFQELRDTAKPKLLLVP